MESTLLILVPHKHARARSNKTQHKHKQTTHKNTVRNSSIERLQWAWATAPAKVSDSLASRFYFRMIHSQMDDFRIRHTNIIKTKKKKEKAEILGFCERILETFSLSRFIKNTQFYFSLLPAP
jgi:hypothetical protein